MAPWSRAATLLVALCGLHTASGLKAVRNAVTPIEKVITLLTDLEAKVTEEGAKEAAEYDKYACFCKSTADSKTNAIKKEEEKIKELSALIDELKSDIEELDASAVKLGGEIEATEKKIKDEKEDRKEERDEYEIEDANVTQAIDAVDRAIDAMKNSKGDLSDDSKADLMQVAQKVTDKAQVAALLEAAQHNSKQAAGQSPPSYEYRSNDIIAVLQALSTQFKNRQKDLYQTEFDANAMSEKKVLAWEHENKAKASAKLNAETLSAKKTEEKEEADGMKSEEEEAKDADTAFRTELTKECENRATEFDQRSKARAAELTALSEAKETLKDGAASNFNANKKLTGLSAVKATVKAVAAKPQEKKAAASFLQLRSKSSNAAAVLARAMQRLSKLESPVLAAVAIKADALGPDHFVKVRGIIKDLIGRLEEEKIAEASQKSFCDVEMAEVLSNRDKFNLETEEKAALIQQKTSFIAATQKEISTLSQEVADISKALNEATELRQQEKAANAQTVEEAKAGAKAVENALTVLKSFYEFLQKPADAGRDGQTVKDMAPEMSYSGDYKGAQDSSKGILGLLEVIKSDFDRTSDTVEDEETENAKEFKTYEKDSKDDVTAKKKLIKDKEAEIVVAEEKIVTGKDDKAKAERLHGDALAELEKLKPMCVAAEESYEERTKKRREEIEALKEAHKILEEWQN